MLSVKPWTLETVLLLLLGIITSFFSIWLVVDLVLLMMGIKKLDENSTAYIVIGTISLHGPILLIISAILKRKHIKWSEAFGFSRYDLQRTILLGILLAIMFLPVGLSLQYLSTKALTLVHIDTPEQQAVQTLKSSSSQFNQIFLVVWAVVVAPFAEEVLFRGILYPTIKQIGFPRAALWGTALLFAFIHGNLAAFVPLTILAVALTFLYEKTDNLLAPIVAHSLFNATNVVILYAFK